MVLPDLTAFAWYTWSVTKRQRQAQQGALNLIRELRDIRVGELWESFSDASMHAGL